MLTALYLFIGWFEFMLVQAPLAAHARSWFGLEPIDAQQVWFGVNRHIWFGLVGLLETV